MTNEKMRVLDMLNDGKISAEDAIKLIEVLGARQGFISQETKENVEDKLQTLAKDISKFAKDASNKAQVIYKDVEPKIKKASQVALEKAAAAFDTLAQTIGEQLERSAETCCDETDGCCKPCEESSESKACEESREN